MEPPGTLLSQSSKKEKKTTPPKKFLKFRKWNLLTLRLKKFLYFLKKNVLGGNFPSSEKSTLKNFPIFKKIELSSLKLKKFLHKNVFIFSQKKLFLYFRKWKTLIKILLIQEGTFRPRKNFLYIRRELAKPE